MKRLIHLSLAILFLTAAYVYAWPSANVPYFGAIFIHLFTGIVFLVLLTFGLLPFLQNAPVVVAHRLDPAGVWRRAWIVVLVFTGTRRAEWPLLYIHIGACVARRRVAFFRLGRPDAAGWRTDSAAVSREARPACLRRR